MKLIENIFWLTACIYNEARGEAKGANLSGLIAVGHVILNRVLREKRSVKDVVLRPWQFSWANGNKRPAIKNYTSFIKCQKAALQCFDERLEGKTMKGADHYFAEYINAPAWSKNMTKIAHIGKHMFFKE